VIQKFCFSFASLKVDPKLFEIADKRKKIFFARTNVNGLISDSPVFENFYCLLSSYMPQLFL